MTEEKTDTPYIAELERRNDQLQKDVAALEKTIEVWARITPRASDRIGKPIYRQSYSALLRRWFGA